MSKVLVGFFASELIKVVALVVIPILGHSAECETKVMNPLPWLMTAAVVPMAWLLVCAVAIKVWDLYMWEMGDNDSYPWAELSVSQLVIDFLFGAVWLSIGAYIASQLENCPEQGITIATVVYLALLVVRAVIVAAGLACH
jgi:hypothetical protein